MIAFKYTKTDGAEYISHLDLLRHIYRTMRRAGIPVEYSRGFHRHPRIFMNNPLGTGIKSVAEYAAADSAFDGDFAERFNAFSPAGIKCLKWARVKDNPNYADCITACTYSATGLKPFDAAALLAEESIKITDMRGREVDIRPRIYAVEWQNGELNFTLGCGENNLRPDLFCAFLSGRYGGRAKDIIKTASLMRGDEFV